MKKLIVIAAALAGLLLLLWQAGPVIRHYRAEHLQHSAEAAAASHQNQKALSLYQLALRQEQDNPSLLRSCADFLKMNGRPEEIELRARLSQLDPDNTAARLNWAEAALLHQQISTGRHLLESCTQAPASHADKVRYYHLLSLAFFMSGDLSQADAACVQALQLDPVNKQVQANQAMIRLSSPSLELRQQALTTLDWLSYDPVAGPIAFNTLMKYAAQIPQMDHGQPVSEPVLLAEWLRRFRAQSPLTSPGYLPYLGALARWRPTDFPAELNRYKKAAAGHPEMYMPALRWMAACGLFQDALDFARSGRATASDAQEELLLEAQCLFALGRNDELTTLLNNPALARPFRLAWLEKIRCQAGTEITDHSSEHTAWIRILESAQDNPVFLQYLLTLASDWGWTSEYEKTLWFSLEKRGVNESDVLDRLYKICLSRGDEEKLLQVVKRQSELYPENQTLLNNLTYLRYLLGQDLALADQTIRNLSPASGKDPTFIATRAFGCWKEGRLKEALALFRDFDCRKLRGTAPGVIYGMLLADAGDPAARDYLQGAQQWADLPRERQLLHDALQKIPAPPNKPAP